MVILAGPMTLTAAQVTMLHELGECRRQLDCHAARPAARTPCSGLRLQRATLSNAYMLVDTSTAAGNGIVGQPMQFHGLRIAYTLNGASKHRDTVYESHYRHVESRRDTP